MEIEELLEEESELLFCLQCLQDRLDIDDYAYEEYYDMETRLKKVQKKIIKKCKRIIKRLEG